MQAKLLRIHLNENDCFESQPLYEAVIAQCREQRIAGATVFRGLEGFGGPGDIHRHRLVTRDQPLIIVIVDSEEAIERFIPVVEKMLERGIMAVSQVDMVRIERPSV
jgi:PII-like signaling protein